MLSLDIDALLSKMGFDSKDINKIKKGQTEIIFERNQLYPIFDLEKFCVNYLPEINFQIIAWMFNKIRSKKSFTEKEGAAL
jgi:hypothetical protein